MNLNKYIDHTLLKADATSNDITTLCNQAKECNFMSVCVNPSYVSLAKKILINTDIKICTVIGFPLGMSSTANKVDETKIALYDGADEIDMVINIGRLKDKNYDYVLNEIKEIKKVCKKHILKVIIETCLLTNEEKEIACHLIESAKADFVKTSTGFSHGGATVDDIKLLKKIVGNRLKIKASGGIKTKEDMLKMISAGADRIGTSNGVNLIK